MGVQSSDLVNGVPVSPWMKRIKAIKRNQIASIIAWFGAAYTTYLCVLALEPKTEWLTALGIGMVFQFVFTVAERPFLQRKASIFTYLVLAVDAIINAGGIYPALANLSDTPPVEMIASVGIDSTVSSAARLLIALVLGVIIALAPEALWRMEE